MPEIRVARAIGVAVNWYIVLMAFSGLAEIGCTRPDGEVKEWRPSDHDQEVETNRSNNEVASIEQDDRPASPSVSVAKPASGGSNDALTDARNTWDRLCSGCHGLGGHGDGPRAESIGARDLASAAWQKSRSDDDIIKAIRSGRGRMPAFSLPVDSALRLVKLIRSFGTQ